MIDYNLTIDQFSNETNEFVLSGVKPKAKWIFSSFGFEPSVNENKSEWNVAEAKDI